MDWKIERNRKEIGKKYIEIYRFFSSFAKKSHIIIIIIMAYLIKIFTVFLSLILPK